MLSFKPAFPFSSFIYVKSVFSSFSISAIRVVSSAYLRLLIYLLAILIPACASFNPVFLMSAFLGLCYFLFFQGYQLCNFEQVLSLDYLICKIKGLDILSKVHLEANMYSEFKAVQSSISCTLARVLVSQGCCNSIPKLGGLRKTDFITVLGPQDTSQIKMSWAMFSVGPRVEAFLALFTSWQFLSLFYRCITPVLSLSSPCVSPHVSICVSVSRLPLFIRTPVILDV